MANTRWMHINVITIVTANALTNVCLASTAGMTFKLVANLNLPNMARL